MIKNLSLDKIYHFLLVFLAFLIPLTVFGANLIIVIISILWLFSGSYKSKFSQIIRSKLLIASLIFYGIHVLGLLWTSDLSWGFKILHKMWYFLLLLPILYTIAKKEYFIHCVAAFTIAMTFSEATSYLIWFEIIPEIKNATVHDPTPFMSHVSYNPILAFTIYIVSHKLFFDKSLNQKMFFLYSCFLTTMTINMFITGGRAGHVMYFAMLAILIFQFFNAEKVKSLIAMIIIIPSIFFIAYQTGDLFKERVDLAINDVITYEFNKETSVGKRMTYAINSYEIIKDNPFIGVGTGDFPSEYQKISVITDTTEYPTPTNPHNMFTLILVQLGLLGLISLLSIFYYQIKISFNSSDKFIRDMGITLPLLFLVIMLGESYLLGHFTTLMFVFFSAFLYQDSEASL
jgi:O-antigen ligase